ncbi:histidine--tRNA ligase [Prochlorococcus sp. MIT 1341]|uniref:histidine--tRNA ligase n=1 Tax=Prochlorococcus sp. MIT 1341 TaxID=3096221 RepID=UPI002A74A4FD|nr:histidine--tRNA ligase [Prochlorococcus sp. MIT 1341]
MSQLRKLRGMVDLLPKQTSIWQQVEAIARAHFIRAGIKEIRTPLLEATELFSRGIGEETDVVGKEMYSFSDRGDRSCTLRPEGTASVVRAVLENGLLSQGIQRLWYGGPMFRYERPQAGRQRQFHQIGVEYIGLNQARSDAEVIAIAWNLLKDLGLSELTLEMNSLGNTEDRRNFRNQLFEWLHLRQSQLDPDSQKRLFKNPLRILDSKNAQTQSLLKNAPKLKDSLSEESQIRFKSVQEHLQELGIPFKLNERLVRGLDYYDHTAFEVTSDQLGAQATVCGGGRYNRLVEQLGGPPTAAIGWAIGIERLILLIEESSRENPSSKATLLTKELPPDIFVVNKGKDAEKKALVISQKLRERGFKVELDCSSAAFGKQFKRANRSGAKWALVIGDDEVKAGKAPLKLLQNSSEKEELLKNGQLHPLDDLESIMNTLLANELQNNKTT